MSLPSLLSVRTAVGATCMSLIDCRDSLNQPLPVAAAANEAYKQAKAKGRADDDFAAVFEAICVESTPACNGN